MAKWKKKPLTMRRKFRAQRAGAAYRNIEWRLSFEEWREIWQNSGHWEERGRRIGQYCMCRIGDSGPYAVGNVFIGLFTANVSFAKNPRKTLPVGVRKTQSGTYAAHKCGHHLGTFPTVERAHQAYLNV